MALALVLYIVSVYLPIQNIFLLLGVRTLLLLLFVAIYCENGLPLAADTCYKPIHKEIAMSDLKNDLKNVPYIKQFFGEYLDLRKDKDNEALIVESIRNGVEFKGTNLWILIFAIFIASLGLNVNSTAVIIGAMLISPLMGPIMGVGLAIGQNDFELLKRSLKSYLVATVFSVITSTIYFSLTPLDEVQSELLARTSPTIYDVLIALCGGLAGIIALSTKEKGNVIPGVAIATALMPPLCTAGFGLATGNLLYFFRCVLFVFYQFSIYQSGYFYRGACHAFPT